MVVGAFLKLNSKPKSDAVRTRLPLQYNKFDPLPVQNPKVESRPRREGEGEFVHVQLKEGVCMYKFFKTRKIIEFTS